MRQRQFAQVASMIESSRREHGAVIDELDMVLADALRKQNLFEQALEVLTRVREDSSSLLREQAIMEMAEIHRADLADRAASLRCYEDFLATFPKSVYIDVVRKRIRELL